MKRGGIVRWLAGVMITVLMLWLANRTGVEKLPYQQLDEVVVQAADMETRINQQLVLSRFGLLPHYDDTVSYQQQALLALQQAQERLLLLGADSQEYQQAWLLLQEDLLKKLALIEQFKTGHAILKNSIAYLPVMVMERLTAQVPSDDAQGGRQEMISLLALLSEMVLLSGNPDEDGVLHKLEGHVAGLVKHPQFADLLAHVMLVLQWKPRTDQLLYQILDLL